MRRPSSSVSYERLPRKSLLCAFAAAAAAAVPSAEPLVVAVVAASPVAAEAVAVVEADAPAAAARRPWHRQCSPYAGAWAAIRPSRARTAGPPRRWTRGLHTGLRRLRSVWKTRIRTHTHTRNPHIWRVRRGGLRRRSYRGRSERGAGRCFRRERRARLHAASAPLPARSQPLCAAAESRRRRFAGWLAPRSWHACPLQPAGGGVGCAISAVPLPPSGCLPRGAPPVPVWC